MELNLVLQYFCAVASIKASYISYKFLWTICNIGVGISASSDSERGYTITAYFHWGSEES
jgi:hypothetical protein